MSQRIEQARVTILSRYKSHQEKTKELATTPPDSPLTQNGRTPEERLAIREERKRERIQALAERAKQEDKLFATINGEPVLFADVTASAWYAPYISFVINEGIAQGYSDEAGKPRGEFGVSNPVTRAEVLKMSLEASKQADDLSELAPTNKTPRNSWAAAYVKKAEDLGVSVFQSNPDVHAAASRGEVIQAILEVLQFPIAKQPSTFSDVPPDSPFSQAIATAAFYGFIQGDTDSDGKPLNRFRPEEPINRADVSKIIALAREVLEQ